MARGRVPTTSACRRERRRWSGAWQGRRVLARDGDDADPIGRARHGGAARSRARYRLRYIILYREVLAKKQYANIWAWGYATLIGALFLPGKQQEVYGYIEATMFDVKTGL